MLSPGDPKNHNLLGSTDLKGEKRRVALGAAVRKHIIRNYRKCIDVMWLVLGISLKLGPESLQAM